MISEKTRREAERRFLADMRRRKKEPVKQVSASSPTPPAQGHTGDKRR
jgi:hypothetical protein